MKAGAKRPVGQRRVRPPRREREIPLRELRNNVSKILAAVEKGARFRITVRGRPVADLTPASRRRIFVPWGEVEDVLRKVPLDDRFMDDIAFIREQRIEE